MDLNSKFKEALKSINEVIVDKENEVELAMVCLLAGGHLLIEDGPGVGKTTLAQALAKVLGLDFSRIQFTSDLLPQDVLGGLIYDETEKNFNFIRGPIFTQFLLADELNRANPRTQSAFLQAMEERDVTIEGKTHALPRPFMVIATQNPSEQTGTFPLPESQLDRFLLCLELKPPSFETEAKIIRGQDPRQKLKQIEARVGAQEILQAHEAIDHVKLSEVVSEYIVSLLTAGRARDYKFSTRAGMSLAKAAKAAAWLSGEAAVSHDQVKKLAPYVLGHRLGVHQNISMGFAEALKLVQEVKINL